MVQVNGTSFTPDDLIEGETLSCKFESGVLQGWEFDLSVDEQNFSKKFEIIHQTLGSGEDPVIIPNRNLCSAVGDTFVLTGVKLPEAKIKEAEQELLKVGKIWAEKNSKDTDVYDCPTNPVYCAKQDKNYAVGQKVLLVDPRFSGGVRSSRIRAYEKKLWNVYDAVYTVGDNTVYSRLGSIESNIKEGQYAERIGVNGSGTYLIRSKYDNTPPTDYNAYAALRAEKEFLHKNKSDIA
ncbi:MAG: hypothetical protein LIP01_15675 [Tannerellaceae bacterium]|nr:hypothetical protein [Tannerellaceae bacterium]